MRAWKAAGLIVASAAAAFAAIPPMFSGTLELSVAAAMPQWRISVKEVTDNRVSYVFRADEATVSIDATFLHLPADAEDALKHFKRRFGRTGAKVNGMGDDAICWIEAGGTCLLACRVANAFIQVGAPSYDDAIAFGKVAVAAAGGL
ncbi:MAG TPA: hypothetical protein VIH35_06160 [Kiritimatiellia bacterium]|jgi:hypothetical protein